MLLWWLLVSLVLLLIIDDAGDWENNHYARTVDLSRGYVKETDLISAVNTGSLPQDTYYFTVNDGYDQAGLVSVISVSADGTTIPVKEKLPGFYAVAFPNPVAAGGVVELTVNYVLLHALAAVPDRIGLADTQQLVVKTNKMPYTPYLTKEYLLRFIGVGAGEEMDLELELATEAPELVARVEDKALVYGPIIEDIAPFTVSPMGLWYEHQLPVAEVENLHRLLWIPGRAAQVQFEEYYELTNAGAELDSGFLRVDWMKGRYEVMRQHWALKQLEFPMGDNDYDNYYYTDKVGMVLTHNKISNFVVLQPRFPLVGGWHYNFTLGWNNDIGKNVHQVDTDTYIARAPLLNTLRDVTYNNVYLLFYLPEGAEFVNVLAPIDFETVEVDHEFSFLDVSTGHTKVTIKMTNLFDDLSRVDAFVVYKYTQALYWLKVAKIGGFAFVGLISYYLLNLIDLSV